MSRNKKLFIFGLLIFGVIIRLMPYVIKTMNVQIAFSSTILPWNISPFTSICLLVGAVYASKYSYIVPMAILFVCDIGIYLLTGNLDYTMFANSPGLHVTYITMIIIALSGNQFLRNYSFTKIIGVGLVAELFFFLMSNGATWWFGTMYAHTLSGLMTCFTMAIPFAGRSFVSTLIYAPVLFYAYHYICLGNVKLVPQLDTVEAEHQTKIQITNTLR